MKLKSRPYNNLGLNLYSEVLDNGLTVYIVPTTKNNNIYVTFSTKFGSRIDEFEVNNKMIKVPLGVAHFLEHKAFEQKDGTDPFSFFSERGAGANANTNYDKTTYLFSGTDFFEENLNYLLDYVQDPYFTEENVEKEKGIIIQEYEMYQDRPFTRGYEGLIRNSFINDAVKYPIIGIPDEINSITKDHLYDCYNTFYNPSNMFVVITGNVNPDEAIKIIKKNQENKTFNKNSVINIKNVKEPNKIDKDFEEVKMDVTVPKVLVGYKLNTYKLKEMFPKKYMNYIVLIFDILFGSTSKANEDLKNNNIIYGDVMLDYIEAGDYCLFIVASETNKIEDFTKYIDSKMTNIFINEDELERKKKAFIGSTIALSDDIFSINDKIMNEVIKYGEPLCNEYDLIKSFKLDELNDVIKHLSFDKKSVFVVNCK